MSIVTLFKSKHGNTMVITPNGERMPFAGGRYWTTDKKKAAYLSKLAETGECGVYIDKNEPEVDTENASPMAALERKIRAQVEEEIKSGKLNLAAKTAPGNTEQAPLQNSTQNTLGTATVQGAPIAKGAPVKVSGDAGEGGLKASLLGK